MKVTLKDGSVREYAQPMAVIDIAKDISEGLARNVCAATVNGEGVDIKRRTVANEACDAERVVVNGKTARASYEVKVGDVIEINLGQKPVKLRVTALKETTNKDNASENFEIL